MNKKFKYTAQALAASVLFASATGSALAIPVDGSPDIVLYLPGSQANDPNYVPALCADTPTTYFGRIGAGSVTNNNYTAWYCNTNSSKIAGLVGTKKIWISRRRLGASFVGLDAVAKSRSLTYLDPNPTNCFAGGGTFTSAGVNFNYDGFCYEAAFSSSPGPGSHLPTAASSDITVDVFHGSDNVAPGSSDINPSAFTTTKAISGHIVGIAVTKALRDALQVAQKGTLIPSSCVSGDDTSAACVPSLSRLQLATVFSGKLQAWDTFNIGSTDLVSYVSTHGGVAPRDNIVHICRRENGAGQQLIMLANILQYPCLGSSGPGLAQQGGANDTQYATSLGAVDNCLKDYNQGTNGFFGTTNPAPYPNPPATSVAHGNQWAIGFQTTERNINVSSTGYRFIRVEGALPTREQVFLGHYPVVGEHALSWVTGRSDGTAAGPSQPANGNDVLKALNALVTYSQLPSSVNARNANLAAALGDHYFGPAGYIALSANGHAPSTDWVSAVASNNPVTPFTRAASGSPSACTIPIINDNYNQAEMR